MNVHARISRIWGIPLAAFAIGLLGTDAAAQRPGDDTLCEDDAPWETMREEIPGYTKNSCAPKLSPFELFGTGDFAGSGLRSANPDIDYWTTNTGLSDSGKELQGQTLPFGTRGTESNLGGWTHQNFELQFWAAAARGDWQRNREIAPSLNNVTGGGWTYIINLRRIAGYHQWQAHDGSVGAFHSGAQSTAGGGCLEPQNTGYPGYPLGFPMLAANDCPETWGSERLGWGAYTPPDGGFQGRGWIGGIDVWTDYFNDVSAAAGPDQFTFDFWKVPQEYYTRDAVGDKQVFGIMSDHGSQALADWYGSVIPGQSGDPTLEGYPLGLDVQFNAYSFQVPSVNGGFIYEGLIINNSEEIYGVGLDYDSLYFGQWIRPLREDGGGRRANPHAIPERGAILHNELGRTPDCDGALPVPQSIDCSSPRGRTPGFSGGAQGFLIAKSPIGDLRNKHFTDPTSPFYFPNHPLAGDTVTFNRMSICSYRCTIQHFIFDARKGFGILSAKPRETLDGRDPVNDLSPFERWEIFHQFYAPDGTERFCNLDDPRGPGCFGYRVPGDWSYTNRPPAVAGTGGPDTLWIDNCRPPTDVTHPGANECTALWADTLPDRTLNWTQNVIFAGVGPFPLAAGDTAPYVVAAFAGKDSAGVMQYLEAFENFYYTDFYLGPGLPAAPNITSAATTSGSARLGRASITLFFDDAAETWVDPFGIKILGELRNPTPGTLFDAIIDANPQAADELEAILEQNNVDSVYMYKSCDRGRTFTSDAGNWDCEPSPAYNTAGIAIGNGWEAWSIFTPDADGEFPSSFRDTEGAPGQQYLYSLVAHTPGVFLETAYSIDTDNDGIYDDVSDTTLVIVPAGSSVFSANPGDGPVAEVYIPASMQAGSELAYAELLDRTGPVHWNEDQVEILIEQNATTEGTYSLAFGSDAVVTEYRPSLDRVRETQVQLEQSVRARMPDGSIQEMVYDTIEFVTTVASGILVGSTSDAVVTTTTVGNEVVRTIEMNEKTGILLDDSSEPVFVSSRLQEGAFTPGALLTHPTSPQFVVEIDDDPGQYVRDFWAIDDPEDDDNYGWTLDEDLRDRSNPSVVWLQGSSTASGMQYGPYVIDFGAEVYPRPLPVVDVFNRAETQAAFESVVSGRNNVTSTEVSQDIVDAIQRDMDPTVELDSLVAVGLPFFVKNLGIGEDGVGTNVTVAMLARSKLDSIVLGNAPDSVTAPVPAGVWVGGEPLIFLEEVEFAQTDASGNLQLDGSGMPVMTSELVVTWEEAVMGCDDPRPTCNPVSGPALAAIPGHVHVRPNGTGEFPNGWDLNAVYKNPFTSQTTFTFDVSPSRTGRNITRITQAQLDSVLVVPNPYVGRSAYEVEGSVKRLMFTHLPPSGTIQIYTASGQFVQRLRWSLDDLAGNGDLFWNMQTREGNLIASGLYIFTITTHSPDTGERLKKLGKFIVIR